MSAAHDDFLGLSKFYRFLDYFIILILSCIEWLTTHLIGCRRNNFSSSWTLVQLRRSSHSLWYMIRVQNVHGWHWWKVTVGRVGSFTSGSRNQRCKTDLQVFLMEVTGALLTRFGLRSSSSRIQRSPGFKDLQDSNISLLQDSNISRIQISPGFKYLHVPGFKRLQVPGFKYFQVHYWSRFRSVISRFIDRLQLMWPQWHWNTNNDLGSYFHAKY